MVQNKLRGGKMKKKLFLLCTVSIFIILCVYAVSASDTSFFKSWGDYLGSSNKSDNGESELYAVGKDVVITVEEIEQAKQFYILSGKTEKEALSLAVSYMEKYETMYYEATRNGYEATDEEIKAKVSEIKEMLETAEQSESMKQVMEGFESEDAYWQYEYEVYKKSLPIEKYRIKLEEEFFESNEYEQGSSDGQDVWISWYEEFQEKLAEKQMFRKVN